MATQKNKENDFEIVIASEPDANTVILTSAELTQKWVDRALSEYDPSNKMYSAYLNDSGTTQTLTQDLIASLGESAQTNIDNLLSINSVIRQYVNTDDLIGMVVQSISNNINTSFKLSYKNFGSQRNKNTALKKVKELINDFNEQVDIEQFISDAILISYLEGNYCSVLRNQNANWQIDFLPLGIVENSGYESNGNPILMINMDKLKTGLSKTMIKNRKGEYLFFKNVEEEIKANYPPEVYTAYTGKETYSVLDPEYTGMVRVNNFGRKYGLSPIFRALSPTLMLKEYQNADSSTAKSKAKKIIHQKLRKECLGPNGDRKEFEGMAYAHSQLLQAWKNNTVIVTTTPAVESISYVEPKTDDIAVEKVNLYRNKVLSSLGVAFLAADKSQTASTANINLSQLMKCINQISKKVEKVIQRYYRTLLSVNNIDAAYCPSVKIIDSELLEMDIRMDLAKLLYATFACSRETALGIVGVDVGDEKVKREYEQKEGYDQVFVPYSTAYNTSGGETEDSSPGRPSTNEDKDKQGYDEEYN